MSGCNADFMKEIHLLCFNMIPTFPVHFLESIPFISHAALDPIITNHTVIESSTGEGTSEVIQPLLISQLGTPYLVRSKVWLGPVAGAPLSPTTGL